jgi:antitoxin component of MazEF toxin-antitoxin module
MPLIKKVTRHGNSSGIILDQPILKQVGWDTGTEVELRVEGETIILTKHRYAGEDQFNAAADRVFKRHAKSLERLAK